MTAPALLILDMLNTLDFPEARQLYPKAMIVAKKIKKLKERCKKKKIPVIYVNDNFGQWRSDWKQIFTIVCSPKSRGEKLAHLLKPEDDDFFVLKPKHSGFYSTTLEVLLEQLGVRKLIITGIAGNICVLFTANDAHMRDYEVIVPKDCIASNTVKDNNFALHQFENVFSFKITPSPSLKLN